MVEEVLNAPESFKLKSKDGNVVEYSSTLTWGKEKKLLKLIGSVLQNFSTTDESGDVRISPEKIVLFFAEEAPELVTEAVSIITGQSAQDIDESYTGQEILEFTIPFLIAFIRRFASTVSFVTASEPGSQDLETEKELPRSSEKENMD